MQHLLRFTSFLLCVMVFQLLGCLDNADIVKIIEEEDTTPPETVIFEKLRNEFEGRLENHGDFTALRNITTSRTYLDFLEETYPTENRAETLEEYLQVAPPDPERYTSFLEKWADNPTEEDIAVMHRITINRREANLILFNMRHLPKKQEIARNVILIFEKRIGVMTEPVTEAFIHRHQIPLNAFVNAVGEFVAETEKADAIWLHEQIEEHGTDNGLLWSAIRKPALIGEVLQNFSSTDIFLKWIDMIRMRENDD